MIKHKKTAVITIMTFVAIQIVVIIILLINKRHDSVYGNAFITISFIVYTFLEFKLKYHTENYIRILLAVVIIGHSLFGEVINLYEKSTVFDKVLHLVGTYGFSLFSYSVVNQLVSKPSPSKTREFIFIAALGMSLGSLFEITEFVMDLITNPVVRYQTDLIDTNFDIIFNNIGAIAAAVHLTLLKKDKRQYSTP